MLKEVTALSPILCSIAHAALLIGRPERVIYNLIGNGQIRAVKSDGRTLVVVKSLQDYAANLPSAVIAPSRARLPARMRAGAHVV